MHSAPLRFLNTVFWPFTVWASLTRLAEHPADDYVERTSPIVAFAIGFWICAASAAALWFAVHRSRSVIVGSTDFEGVLQVMNPAMQPVLSVLLVFLPAIYAIGFWMFTVRDERFPR